MTADQSNRTEPRQVTIKELASELGADPRDLRKWLRAEGKGLGGRGRRYSFTPEQASQVSSAWKTSQTAGKSDAG